MIETSRKIELLNSNDVEETYQGTIEKLLLHRGAGDYYFIDGESEDRIKVLNIMSILTGLPVLVIEVSKINPNTFSMPILVNQNNITEEKNIKLGLDLKQTLADILKSNTFEISKYDDFIKNIASSKSLRQIALNYKIVIDNIRATKKCIILIDDYYDNQSNIIQSRLWNLLELKPSDVNFIVGSDKCTPSSNEFFSLLEIDA